MRGVYSRVATALLRSAPRRPEWRLVASFALVILTGAFLLMLPAASTNGEWTPLRPAFFTAMSAGCVTGLSVVDVSTHFSRFGQIVIMLLMQIGGLGLMTFGTFVLVLAGRRLSMRDEALMLESLGAAEDGFSVRRLLKRTIYFSLIFETIGAGLLFCRFMARGFEWPKAAYHGVFHAVSGFCNAGLALYKDNLVGFQNDPVIVLTIASLFILGGIGFPVFYDLTSVALRRRERGHRHVLNLHSRVVFFMTASLIVLGTLLFLLSDWKHALRDLPVGDKITGAIFQATTPRTAGFNVVPMDSISDAGNALTMLLMAIGGAPGSTAGGIKVTSVFVMLLCMVGFLRGRQATVYRGRTITQATVRAAIATVMLCLLTIFTVYGILLAIEPSQPGTSRAAQLLYETISAFCTVGLSLDLTPTLQPLSQWVVALAMFVGRLGPVTLALTIARKPIADTIRYPEEPLSVA